MPACPRCGNEMPEDAKFCPLCGQPTVAPPPPTVAPNDAPRRTTGPLPIREYLKTGWELFKRYPGGFIGFMLLCTLMEVLVQIVPHLIPIVGILAALAFFAVTPALSMGNFIVSAELLQGRIPQFSHFFLGFRFFVPLLLVELAFVLIFLVLILLAVLIGGLIGFLIGKSVAHALLVFMVMLAVLVAIYLGVGLIFAYPLVVDRHLSCLAALKVSFTVVRPLWFGMFGFLLLLGLINLGGLLLLLVAFLVTDPFTKCAITAAYADVFGLQSDYAVPDKVTSGVLMPGA